ncbi:hypothetical protein [Oceanicola sp. S124]|uniref:hypothetical protein n=1 Tax=Oceanicola sp. S124 TaxID=1042378 RepID=UPI000255817D|nr:hypothetical protein [Oceanicola sp. S124]
MDPILYRPLDALDERVRRASEHQRHQPRPQQQAARPKFSLRERLGWLGPRWWPGWPDGPLG